MRVFGNFRLKPSYVVRSSREYCKAVFGGRASHFHQEISEEKIRKRKRGRVLSRPTFYFWERNFCKMLKKVFTRVGKVCIIIAQTYMGMPRIRLPVSEEISIP